MKNAKDLHKILDDTIDKTINESIDHKRGSTISRLTSSKIRLVCEEVKYKQLTGRPEKVEFFEL